MYPCTDARTLRVIQFFETLSMETLAQLETVYADQARFKDPFHEISGRPDIHRMFAHMLRTFDTPRFEICSAMAQADLAWLTWNFHIRRGQGELCIHGATQVQFAPDGRVCVHRDYWDTAEELYSKLALLGPVVRFLTRQLRAPGLTRV